jgi:NAD(P) transhydrogenase subunit alpha
MSVTVETGLYVLLLATFVGFEVIRRVPPLFHTPLMSLTNAVAGISLVGSLVVAGADHGAVATALGTIAVTASTINVVGGFLITDRMLRMFRPRDPASAKKRAGKHVGKHEGKPAETRAEARAEKPAATTGASR